MSWQQLVEQFLIHCDVERGLSPNTIIAYRYDLAIWQRFLAQSASGTVPDCVTPALVRQYVAYLKRSGLANVSVERRINGLRSFWKFLLLTERTQRNPLAGLTLPRKERRLATYLTVEELEALLAAAGRQEDRFLGVRDSAALGTLIYAGLRRQELLDLRLGDVDMEDRQLRVVRGKGNRTRVIPLAAQLADTLAEWLGARPHCAHDLVLCGRRSGRLTVDGLQRVLARAKGGAGIDRPGVTLHTLRHSFACALLRGGADLVSIQNLLGHASLETTSVYLHVSAHDLREAIQRHALIADVDRPR